MALSNEWWYQLLVEDGNGGYTAPYGAGYHHLLTASTSSGSADSIFVDDFGDYVELKAKVACNVNNLTFSNGETSVWERYTDGAVIISNGKILVGEGRSTTGVVVDSIYFEAEFDWDPGVKYILAGHARTGFAEDEHF